MERWKCWNPSGTGIPFSPLEAQERIRIRRVGRKAGDLRPMVYSQNPFLCGYFLSLLMDFLLLIEI